MRCKGFAAVILLLLGISRAWAWDPFPEKMPGWKLDGEVRTYTPADLYEYIDGAADLYIRYGFVDLKTASYDTKPGFSLTIDVYRMSDARNAFGIYSWEKHTSAKFLSIGSEGYYEKGILNFHAGEYYVKLSAFSFSAGEEVFLTTIARAVLRKLAVKPDTLEPLLCFPKEGKVDHSERFIPNGLHGYDFLRPVYEADYWIPGADSMRTDRAFIVEARDEESAMTMLDSCRTLARKERASAGVNGETIRMADPHAGPDAVFMVRGKGPYLWGVAAHGGERAERLLEALSENVESILFRPRSD
jgi:hypothetical protein